MLKILCKLSDGDQLVSMNPGELEIAREAILASGVGPVALSYPFVPQNGPGADLYTNDCAIANIVSIMRGRGKHAEVDDIARKYQRPNMPMTVAELMRGLTGEGIRSHHRVGALVEDIAHHMRIMREPVIVLVDYPSLPKQHIQYNGAHYILIYGIDTADQFMYRDPLSQGELLVMTPQQLETAMLNDSKNGNQPQQAIYILQEE